MPWNPFEIFTDRPGKQCIDMLSASGPDTSAPCKVEVRTIFPDRVTVLTLPDKSSAVSLEVSSTKKQVNKLRLPAE